MKERVLVLALLMMIPERAVTAGFDIKTLEQLGYSADIADFFLPPGFCRVFTG